MGNITVPGGNGISNQSLINLGFYFVEKDPFTGKSMWYYKDEIMVNPDLGMKGPIYLYDPWKREAISNRGGEWGLTRATVVTDEELKNFMEAF